MSTITSIMISAFGNKQINPDAEIVSFYMNEIKKLTGIDYLPNIVYSPTINIATGQMSQIPNITFSSLGNISRVTFVNSRVDFIYNFNEGTQAEISSRYNQGIDIIKLILNKSDIMSNRLALNVDLIGLIGDDSRIKSDMMNVLPYYQKRNIKEWSSRINANTEITIQERKELLNVITDNAMVEDPSTVNGKLNSHIDINTIAENIDFRFSSDAIGLFVEEARMIFDSLKKEIEGLL